MIHPLLALLGGLCIGLIILLFGLCSGPQSDVGYTAGDDIGADTPSYDSGYETIDTTYNGDDIGSTEIAEYNRGWF